MNNFKKYLNISINIFINLLWVFALGIFINKSLINTIIIMAIWTLRILFGKAKHYSNSLQCFLLQIGLFTSLFLSTYINIYIASLFTFFTVYLMSGWADIKIDSTEPQIDYRGNIKDITLFKNNGEPSKYQKLIDYIHFNPMSEKLIKYEDYIKQNDNKKYMIFKYKFRENMSFDKMQQELDLDKRRIAEQLDIIYETLKYDLQL